MGSLEQIQKSGFLLVGTTGDYFPLSYLNSETGKYEGDDVLLVEKIGETLGVQIQFIKTSWPLLENDLREKKFDLAICGITITKNRCNNFLMSKPYRKTGKTILCRKEDENKFLKLEQINNTCVRVMYNPGGTNEKFVMENIPLAEKIMHEVNQEIPDLIAEGKADVMITETVEAEYYIKKNNKLAAPLISKPFTQDKFGVLINKEDTELLHIVNSIIE